MTVFIHNIYNTQILIHNTQINTQMKKQAFCRLQSSIPGCKELNLFIILSDKEQDLQATSFILTCRPRYLRVGLCQNFASQDPSSQNHG